MLIVNKDFHDYYDTAMVHGVDKSIVYDRKKIDIKAPKYWDRNSPFGTEAGSFKFHPHLIGFCGQFYPCVEIENTDLEKSFRDVVFRPEQLMDFYEEHEIKSKKRYFWGRNSLDSESGVKGFFGYNWEPLSDLFREHHTPILLFTSKRFIERRLVVNPRLSDWKFARVFPPNEAFQKVEQYLSGVLGNIEKDTDQVDDQIKLQQKGFNRWTFKKMPGEKKRKGKPKKK